MALTVLLAVVHVFAGRLRMFDRLPRSAALSFAGGVSIAYVFIHVLPEVATASRRLEERFPMHEVVESHAYLLVMAGFVGFYGLEQYVNRRKTATRSETSPIGVFWTHIGSFAVYNGLIGYLLFHREAPGVGSQFLFTVAMGAHFLVNDFGLRRHHGDAYRRIGRWVLAGGIFVGAAFGATTSVRPSVLAVPFSVLAGGIVLNVIKEELPDEYESQFGAFALGAGGNSLLLLAV